MREPMRMVLSSSGCATIALRIRMWSSWSCSSTLRNRICSSSLTSRTVIPRTDKGAAVARTPGDLAAKAFSLHLQKERKRRGLGRQQLASPLGVTRQAVDSWERGISLPSFVQLSRSAMSSSGRTARVRTSAATGLPPCRFGGGVTDSRGHATVRLRLRPSLAPRRGIAW
jgi:DNA-binding XRE family transcriptional regulator